MVENALGKVGYEYSYTIEPIEVDKLYPLLNVNMGYKQGQLNEKKQIWW